jgi:2-oxoisovalerate dehydrogenase E1 component
MPEADLISVMENALAGDILRAVLPAGSPFPEDIRGLAEKFLLYGALAEIFAKRTGFNRGLGGSMHAFFLPFGVFPNNAIVAAPGYIVGAAPIKKQPKPGVVVCNIGTRAGEAVLYGRVPARPDGSVQHPLGRQMKGDCPPVQYMTT